MSTDEAKRFAAEAALHYLHGRLQSHSIVGIGTGSTAAHFIAALAGCRSQFDGAVASSEASAALLRDREIPVYSLNAVGTVPFYVDGADEIDGQLRMIKGGGGALTREKILAAAADEFICIADQSKQHTALGSYPLAVEVLPMARSLVARALTGLGGRPVWRSKFVTDNGNAILDVHELNFEDPAALESRINDIPGVLSNGIFALRPADRLFLADHNGKIRSFS